MFRLVLLIVLFGALRVQPYAINPFLDNTCPIRSKRELVNEFDDNYNPNYHLLQPRMASSSEFDEFFSHYPVYDIKHGMAAYEPIDEDLYGNGLVQGVPDLYQHSLFCQTPLMEDNPKEIIDPIALEKSELTQEGYFVNHPEIEENNKDQLGQSGPVEPDFVYPVEPEETLIDYPKVQWKTVEPEKSTYTSETKDILNEEYNEKSVDVPNKPEVIEIITIDDDSIVKAPNFPVEKTTPDAGKIPETIPEAFTPPEVTSEAIKIGKTTTEAIEISPEAIKSQKPPSEAIKIEKTTPEAIETEKTTPVAIETPKPTTEAIETEKTTTEAVETEKTTTEEALETEKTTIESVNTQETTTQPTLETTGKGDEESEAAETAVPEIKPRGPAEIEENVENFEKPKNERAPLEESGDLYSSSLL